MPFDPSLFLFDFDGTALGGHTPYEQFPPEFAAFLDALHDRGIRWGTNSGWGVKGQRRVIESSPVKSRPLVLIGDTGREIGTLNNGTIEPDLDYEAIIREEDRQFRERNRESVVHALRNIMHLDLIGTFGFDFSGTNVFHFRCPEAQIRAALDAVVPLTDSGEYYLLDDEARGGWVTLCPVHMNKGAPVLFLQKKLAVEPGEIILAGDESNDIPMMRPEVALHLVCPANAHGKIKEIVERHHGIVASKDFSWGVIEGVRTVVERLGNVG